jgi:hypothetical protein
MESAAQVLFVVVASGANGPAIGERLGHGIVEILPQGEYLDVISLDPESSLLNAVRGTHCPVGNIEVSPKKRSWW